jgi:uncharacterized protein YdaU (DUF1376 family)
MKVRRVDLYSDDFLTGTPMLLDDEMGVYMRICLLIYASGKPVSEEHVRSVCRSHGNAFNRILRRLETLGKIIRNGREIDQKRCENELKRAEKRLTKASQNGAKGGRPKGLAEAGGFPQVNPTSLQHTTNNIQHLEKKPSQRRATRLPADFKVPGNWISEGSEIRVRAGLPTIDLQAQAEHFVDFWHAKAGKDGTKLDWQATWRNWCRNARASASNGHAVQPDLSFYSGPTEPPPPLEGSKIPVGRSH